MPEQENYFARLKGIMPDAFKESTAENFESLTVPQVKGTVENPITGQEQTNDLHQVVIAGERRL